MNTKDLLHLKYRRHSKASIPRARERLTMTYCAKRCQPSSFIHEIPMQMYEYVDYEELMKAPATQEECDDFFADIHKMLREE